MVVGLRRKGCCNLVIEIRLQHPFFEKVYNTALESESGRIGMTKLWDTAKKTYEISDLYSKARISGEYRVVGELQEELDKIEISEVHWWTQLKENTGQAIRLPNPNEGETIAINKEFKIMVLYKREAGLSINSELGNPINTYKVL